MKITNINRNHILNDKKLNSQFSSFYNKNFNLYCNILNTNFALDPHNYFPIVDKFFTFSDFFKWGDELKYKNFYTDEFYKKFNNNNSKFKKLSNVFILGSSPFNNYYRNIITFLPRLFFNIDSISKIAIHRNSSNKFRNFIKNITKSLNKEIQLIYLDDGFYNFTNSQIPQFLNDYQSIKILNN